MKVLIAGGGIGGLSAALCLARAGHRVEVFERAPEFAEIGAGIQLSPNCTRVLHHLGLEPALAACAFLPEATEFRHFRSGRVISRSPLGESVRARYGYSYYHVHRGDLLQVLVNAARRERAVTLHLDAPVGSFADSGDAVEISAGGATWRGDLLIGADGIHSAVRSRLWGEESPTFTGNVAWRALVPAERLAGAAMRPVGTVWWGPHRHFVHYFVRRGELVNCVCVVEKTGWEVESWTARGAHHELKADFAGWHPDVQRLIDHADPDSLYKWALFDRPPMRAWGRGRVTLLGDACHPTLPFMAQGAAMAIEDGAVLAACLDEQDVAGSLARYEKLRRKRTARVQAGSRRNARVFHLTGIGAWLRNRAARAAGGAAMDSLFSYDALRAAGR